MQVAVNVAFTMQDLADWARPFIIRLGEICLPQLKIHFCDGLSVKQESQ